MSELRLCRANDCLCGITRGEMSFFVEYLCIRCHHGIELHPPPLQLIASPSESVMMQGERFPCDDPFFTGFLACHESDDWLELSAPIPFSQGRTKLYIRSSFKSIAEQALMRTNPNITKYAIVTGTPGIGKSVFAYYAFWRLINDKKRVLFVEDDTWIYFDGNSLYEYRQPPASSNRTFWSSDLWCIVDSDDPIKMLGKRCVSKCSVLLVSKMQSDYMYEFRKLVSVYDIFYMPIWTREEMKTVQPLFPERSSDWLERFEHLGGVPRFVLVDVGDQPEEFLRSACDSCSIQDCITLVTPVSELTRAANKLIHIHSQSPYKECEVRYASKTAVSIIATTKWKSARQKMETLLCSCADNPLTAAICGYIFEPYAMKLLENGGPFECRQLVEAGIAKKPPTQTITIPTSPLPRQYADKVELDQLADQLYVPSSPNLAVLDAWIPGFGGFQMTAGKSHAIHEKAPDLLKKLGKDGNRLYFLVPPQKFDWFNKQTPKDVDQYAILIPYPETVVYPPDE